jgi:hypothetical protein
MPSQSVHGKLDSEETDAAAWQATRGAVTGAARVCSFLCIWSLFMFPDFSGLCYSLDRFTDMSDSGVSILQLRLVSHTFIHQYTVV